MCFKSLALKLVKCALIFLNVEKWEKKRKAEGNAIHVGNVDLLLWAKEKKRGRALGVPNANVVKIRE